LPRTLTPLVIASKAKQSGLSRSATSVCLDGPAAVRKVYEEAAQPIDLERKRVVDTISVTPPKWSTARVNQAAVRRHIRAAA
jgi:hypothetical protein